MEYRDVQGFKATEFMVKTIKTQIHVQLKLNINWFVLQRESGKEAAKTTQSPLGP